MGHAEITLSAVCSVAILSYFDKGTRPIWTWTNETSNASPQAIKLNPNCSRQAHSKGSSTGLRNENTECEVGVFRASFIIRPLC